MWLLQDSGKNTIVMDDWIVFLSSNRVANLVKVIILTLIIIKIILILSLLLILIWRAVCMLQLLQEFVITWWTQNSIKCPPTFGPTQLTFAAILHVGSLAPNVHITCHHLLLLLPKTDTHFPIPQRVEDWVDLGGWFGYTQRICTCPQAVMHSGINWTRRRVTLWLEPVHCHWANPPTSCYQRYLWNFTGSW